MTLKLIGAAVLAIVVAFGVGWVMGQSGRSALERDRQTLQLQAEQAQARALIYEARVELFLVNFGNASRRLEEARAVVETMQRRLRESGAAERAGRLEIVLGHIRDAQRLAGSLDAAAQNASAEAGQALAGISLP
jgi:hypothetical protein